MINFFILLLVLLAALTTAFITHPLLPMAVRGDRSTRNPLRMVKGALQPPPPPLQQQISVLELLSKEPYKSILEYFKGWSVNDFLAVTETQTEKLVPKEHLSTGYRLYHRTQERKLKPEANTIYIVASAGGKPMKYGFTTQAEMDAYLTRMGAGGLIASGTDAVLLKLKGLEEGATYSSEIGDGAPLYQLQENAKAVGAQATAWEKQGKLQKVNGVKVPVFGGTREIDGAFFSHEANLLVLCEATSGPMELSGYETLEDLQKMYNVSTEKELQELSNEYADVQLYLAARAAEENSGLFGGNKETSIKMVLAPRVLQGNNLSFARRKEQAGTFYFLCDDGTDVSLGLPVE